MNHTIESVLKKHQLRVTSTRKKILQYFFDNEAALSHANIEKKEKELDRVTIYRTLQAFVEKGVLHTVPTTDNSIKYALCKEDCNSECHKDNHVHFLCTACGSTLCVANTTPPVMQLPNSFLAQSVEVLIKGLCSSCNVS